MILLLGDIHGNFNFLKHQINSKKISDCTIIQVGDFGIGFTHRDNDEKTLEGLNEFLTEFNVTLYAIRGNHDNPEFFKGEHQYSNLKLLPDYTSLELDGNKFLFIGGALSVDRTQRIRENNSNIRYGSRKRCYWETENLVYNSEITKNMKGLDMIVTHTAPDWCFPNNKLGFGSFVEDWAKHDQSLISDLVMERNIMSNIFLDLLENNNIKKHFYGHFHQSKLESLNGVDHHLLDINEFYTLNIDR
jgi:UDP-2,3-diacylglucosamine pyrophosphatase LpxH